MDNRVPLDAIAPLEEFLAAERDDLITLRPHRDNPELTIANYTPNQQFRNEWNVITLNSRGLIFNRTTVEIVARPFTKFFNHNDPKNGLTDTTGAVEVYDKLDGSLGVLYLAPDGQHSISTRGSFHSVQAEHATGIYRSRYAGTWEPHPDYTFMFEIIYPEGKIVLDYGGMDDLVLLGAIKTATGVSVDYDVLTSFGWTGPVAERFPYSTYQDVFTAEQRSDREGFVIRFMDTDQRVKVKFEEYLRIHKFFFGLSKIRVWEMLKNGDDLDAYLKELPDEFTDEAKAWKADIEEAHAALLSNHQALAQEIRPENFPDRQRWFEALSAEAKVRGLTPGFVVGLSNRPYEGNDILQDRMWRSIRPVGRAPGAPKVSD